MSKDVLGSGRTPKTVYSLIFWKIADLYGPARKRYWWRRRELNPRPVALGSWLYMLRVRLLIWLQTARRSGRCQRARLSLTLQPRARRPRDPANFAVDFTSQARIIDVSGFFRPLVRSFRRWQL